MSAAVSTQDAPSRRSAPDTAARKRSLRLRRERGCTVYIDGEQLAASGIGLDEPPPFYSVRGYQRSKNGHTVIVSLYREA